MAANTSVEPGSFKDMEKTGWSRQAQNYDDHLGNISRAAIGPMLDAVGITPGTRLLEVACGPGYGSGMAAAKGVEAIGIDLAPTMVEEARRRFPGRTVQGEQRNVPRRVPGVSNLLACGTGSLRGGLRSS